MTDREKLIELLQEYTDNNNGGGSNHGRADYLLANGVLVPPCKIGDDIWWVNEEKKTVECEKNGIAGVLWNGKEWRICDTDGGIDIIGTQWSCLTKEDAEKILEEIIKNGGEQE